MGSIVKCYDNRQRSNTEPSVDEDADGPVGIQNNNNINDDSLISGVSEVGDRSRVIQFSRSASLDSSRIRVNGQRQNGEIDHSFVIAANRQNEEPQRRHGNNDTLSLDNNRSGLLSNPNNRINNNNVNNNNNLSDILRSRPHSRNTSNVNNSTYAEGNPASSNNQRI